MHATTLTKIGTYCRGRAAAVVFRREKVSVGSEGDDRRCEWLIAWKAAVCPMRNAEFSNAKKSGVDHSADGCHGV